MTTSSDRDLGLIRDAVAEGLIRKYGIKKAYIVASENLPASHPILIYIGKFVDKEIEYERV